VKELPIATTKVEELKRKCRHFNIFPIFLPHYHPPVKNHPVGMVLTNLVAECAGYLRALSTEEISSLVDGMHSSPKMLLDFDPSQPLDDHVYERIAIYYLMGKVQEGYISFRDALFPDLQNSAVLRTYPELAAKTDDDGLVVLDDSFKPMDMGILYKDHMLHYHQCLRRGFSSNPNFDFIGRLLRFRDSAPGCSFRIAIDHNRIMPKEFIERICEMDTWFGPSFQRDLLDDPSAVGVTVVKRRKPSPFEVGEEELDRTEFQWSYRDGIKTFEVEEISTANHKHGAYYLNRYVHAERDTTLGILRHFDGAVKVYLESDYAARLGTHMPSEPRSHAKPKVFRVDGDIDIDQWIELTAHFFKGNEMLIEYFDPSEFERRFGPSIKRLAEIEVSREQPIK
jgi:hypothetical protein